MSLESVKETIEWHPIRLRKADEEEKSTLGFDLIWDGDMPQQEGECLVTLKDGSVRTDELCEWSDGSLYFDTFGDDVTAWAEMPKGFLKLFFGGR